ncbi:MAG: tRNA lysidine(34) synthetase TilS [Candidatus Peribacteria bacterium]|nr:MAG: tRNA lysidine(34) synthetase TilS [Candidatus Peribacteria bacterium]
MFLLYHLLKTPYKHQLVVCYFNHKTRPETDEEEAFLEELGKKEGFKVEIASCDFQKIQSLYPSKSFEELAREKRYAFFDAILHIYKARYIITAHHLDDRIETFFFNLLRGTKLTGLINMTEKNGAILRPLLGIQKQDILSYLEENKLHYFEDATNTDTTITRNYLRHKVLPLFEQVNTHYKGNTEKLIHYFSEMKAYIDEEVERFLQHELSS